MKSLLFLISYLICSTLWSQDYKSALEKYFNAKALQFDIIKKDEKIALGTKSESAGVLKYKKGQIYLVQNGEKKIEVFYSNKVLTLVEYPDLDFDPKAPRKVTVLKNNSSPLVDTLVSLFSDAKAFAKNFEVIKQEKADSKIYLELKPKFADVKNLKLRFNSKSLELEEISFVDDVSTRTTIALKNSKFNLKLYQSDFKYKSLKSDEVLTQ